MVYNPSEQINEINIINDYMEVSRRCEKEKQKRIKLSLGIQSKTNQHLVVLLDFLSK